MNAIGLIKILIIYGVNPLALGCIIQGIKNVEYKHHYTIFSLYMIGYISYLSLWGIVGLIVLNTGHRTYTQAYLICDVMMKIFTIVLWIIWTLLLLLKRINVSDILLQTFDAVKSAKWIHIIAIVEFIIAIFFVIPNPNDRTVLEVITMKKTDALYAYDAVTGVQINSGVMATKFLEVLYAYSSDLTGIYIGRVIQYLCPIFILPVIFGAYQYIAYELFEDNKRRSMFLFIAEIFYGIQIFIDGYVGTSILRNVWNGTTIMVSLMIPLTFMLVIKRHNVTRREYIIALGILMLAASLVYQNGWSYILLMQFLAFILI